MYKKKENLTEEYKQIFNSFDINNDGKINIDELHKALNKLG